MSAAYQLQAFLHSSAQATILENRMQAFLYDSTTKPKKHIDTKSLRSLESSSHEAPDSKLSRNLEMHASPNSYNYLIGNSKLYTPKASKPLNPKSQTLNAMCQKALNDSSQPCGKVSPASGFVAPKSQETITLTFKPGAEQNS